MSSSDSENVIPPSPYSKVGLNKSQMAADEELPRHEWKVTNRVKNSIIKACGSLNRVLPLYDRKKRYYVRCPVPGCDYKSPNIKYHLMTQKHGWTQMEASFFASAMVRKFQHARLDNKSGYPKPYPCLECFAYFDRLDSHLKKSHNFNCKTVLAKIAEAKRFDKEKLFVPLFLRSTFFNRSEAVEGGEPTSASSSGSVFVASLPFSSSSTDLPSSALIVPSDCPSKQEPIAGCSKSSTPKYNPKVTLTELGDEDKESINSLKHLVSSSLTLTESKRRQFQLEKDAFHFYYQSADELMYDFEKWLVVANCNTRSQAKSYKTSVLDILKCCDPTLTLHPNLLVNSNVLEDNFFISHMNNIKVNSKLDENDRKKTISCHTLSNRLTDFCLLLRFSEARNVYFGLSREAIQRVRAKVDELQKLLKPFRSLRRKDTIRKKAINLLNVKLLTVYGRSAFVRTLEKTLKNHASRPTKENAISIRNHLMLSLTVINSLRKSNIALLNIRDYMLASKTECGYCIVQERYKTAYKYGAKNILVPTDLKLLIDLYLLRYRDLLVNDSHFFHNSKTVLELSNMYRPLFPSMRSNQDEFIILSDTKVPIYQMGSSGITSCLTSCFTKSKVKVPVKRVTATCIRGSIATYFANNSSEDREKFATLYMKHNKNTMESFYISQWNASEELRFALGIGQSFGVIENVIVEKAERAPKKESEVLDWLKIHAEEYGFCEVEDIFNEESDDDSDLEECATPSEVFLNQKVTSEDVVVLPAEQNFIDFQCSTDSLVLPSISDVVPTAQCSEDLSPLTESTSAIAHAEQNSSVSTPLASIDSSNFDLITGEQNFSLCTPLTHLDTSKLESVSAEQNSDDSIPLVNLETSSSSVHCIKKSASASSLSLKNDHTAIATNSKVVPDQCFSHSVVSEQKSSVLHPDEQSSTMTLTQTAQQIQTQYEKRNFPVTDPFDSICLPYGDASYLKGICFMFLPYANIQVGYIKVVSGHF